MSKFRWHRRPLPYFERTVYAGENEGAGKLHGAARDHRDRLRAIVIEARSSTCFDCGGGFPVEAMQFDHRDPRTKLFGISDWRSLLPSEQVLRDELAKCDYVCANCHAIRTAKQRALGILPRRKHWTDENTT